MSEKQMQAGMDWIATKLRGIGAVEGITVSPLGWDANIVDLKADCHNFVVSLNGQRVVVTFNDADLEDVSEDPRLQIEVEGNLRAFLHEQLQDCTAF